MYLENVFFFLLINYLLSSPNLKVWNISNLVPLCCSFIFIGWSIDLYSELDGNPLDWYIYLGPPGVEYPTHSPSIKHEPYLLQPYTSTFMTFSLEYEDRLQFRGIFNPREYCDKEASFNDSIVCYKKCFLQEMKVSSKYVINLERVKKSNFSFQKRYDIPLCVPDSINIFDNLDVPICNSSQGVVNFKHLFGSESSIPEFRCDCLDPCRQQKFKFQVKEKYDKLYYISHEIILRLKVLSRTNWLQLWELMQRSYP